MLHRIDLGRALVVLGSLILLASLFLDWFEAGGTAWEVFETLDLVLVALAAGALWSALGAGDRAPVLLRVLPLAAFLIVVVQILNPPPLLQLATDGLNVERAGDPDTGAWLALAGSALMAAGAVLAIARISVTIDLTERRSGAPPSAGAGPPDEPSPAPAADPEPPRGSRSLLDQDEADRPEQPTERGLREVPAIDHREARTTRLDEPEPTQPLRVPPEEDA